MYLPKLIYYHDSRHYLLYRFDPPMRLHQLRKPVDDLIGTGIDTLVYGVGMGQTFLYDTKVGYRFGEKKDFHDHNIIWWRASENLETAIKWISNDKIAKYMSINQSKPKAKQSK